MSSRYSKRHYEDVARILKAEAIGWAPQFQAPVDHLMSVFAGLFAADNPPTCHCGATIGTSHPCNTGSGGHVIEGGFDRELFLAACGLEFGQSLPYPNKY